MRRFVLILPVLLFAGCGDSGDDGGDEAKVLSSEPTREECIDALIVVMESIEVPDAVDPSDGLDDDERPLADAAVATAYREAGIDPDAEDHPCADLTADMTEQEFAEATKDIDPEVLELLGAQAEVTFEKTGEAIG